MPATNEVCDPKTRSSCRICHFRVPYSGLYIQLLRPRPSAGLRCTLCEGRFLMKPETVISVVSAVAAVASAAFAMWQTFEARSAAAEASRAVVASERLESCMRMNGFGSGAAREAAWIDITKKPYRENKRFLLVTMTVDQFGDEALRFRQMAPSDRSEKLLNDTMRLRVALKDMVVDGGDYLSEEQLRKQIDALNVLQRQVCDALFRPASNVK